MALLLLQLAVMQVFAGKTAAQMYTWGSNGYGQLGDGTRNTQLLPKSNAIGNMPLKTVASGGAHSGAVTAAGQAYLWGWNYYGTIGDGSVVDRLTPVPLPLPALRSLVLGQFHSGAITAAGQLYMWGNNLWGQVGCSSIDNLQQSPVLIPVGGEVVQRLALGGTHTSALTASGKMYIWGWNNYGQMGAATLARTQSIPLFVSALTQVVTYIALGQYHSGAVTIQGQLYMWGYNANGQVGDGTTVNRFAPTLVNVNGQFIRAVALGGSHSAVLTLAGAVYSWGLNTNGQLGDGTLVNRLTPVSVVTNGVVATLSLGLAHSAALTTDGRAFMWGMNIDGRLGDGTTTDRNVPTQILAGTRIARLVAGAAHTSALLGANIMEFAGSVEDSEITAQDSSTTQSWVWIVAVVCGVAGLLAIGVVGYWAVQRRHTNRDQEVLTMELVEMEQATNVEGVVVPVPTPMTPCVV